MKIKLINVETEYEDDVEFGTCELCMSIGSVDYPTFFFEKDNGEKFELQGWEWDWGDFDSIYISNIVKFNDYLSELNFDEDTEFDYGWLWNIVSDYGFRHE